MTNAQNEREASIPRYDNKKVGALATVLFEAFKRAEPDHCISKHPTSYMATFADMAHAALVQFPSMLAPDATTEPAIRGDEVERVARAIQDEFQPDFGISRLSYRQARAALAAIRSGVE